MGILMLIMANLIWAGSYPAMAIALRGFHPLFITLIRLGVGSLVMVPFLGWRQNRRSWRWTVPLMLAALAMGVVGFTLPVWLQATGVRLSTAGLAAISVALEPIFTVLIASLVLRQRIQGRQAWALVAALVGSWAVAGFPRPGATGYWLGDLILLLAVVCWASYNVFSEPLTVRLPAATSTAATLLGGFITTLPLMFWAPHAAPMRFNNVGAVIALGYLALMATAGAYLLWMLAVERVNVSDAAIYVYLQPLAGVLLSVAIVGNRITVPIIFGSLLIAAALFLGRPKRRGEARQGQEAV